jgi:hypothetical protein
MEPPPARRIAGTAYFTDRNTPSRFTAVCRRQSANDMSTVLHKIPMPALATITSKRPKRCSVASITPARFPQELPLMKVDRLAAGTADLARHVSAASIF